MSADSRITVEQPWYELFSRGARDWLRHNEKVRESVKASLPKLIGEQDVFNRSGDHTVMVPVRFLEHARFRLADADKQTGVGQGKGEPGNVLRPAQPQPGEGEGQGAGGSGEGEVRFVMEIKIDDIIDWLCDELKLPDLKPRSSPHVDDADFVREGLDKHGPRARLDRRRTMKEAVKRRAVQDDAPAFTNEDLRFRQLVRRNNPALNAVVIFALDVSASMAEAQRKLAKTFFFFALHGIRRQYAKVETVFVAHTVNAWEFGESEFFEVTASGGTAASSAFNLSLDLIHERYDPSRYNCYLFYASDGDNFSEDRGAAHGALKELSTLTNYIGYLEVLLATYVTSETEMSRIMKTVQSEGGRIGINTVARTEDVWTALRHFFVSEAAEAA
jgi:sporulation protein YhbH